MVIFCVDFGTKSAYEWIMYKKHLDATNLQGSPQLVVLMMQVMIIYMPVIWDLVPICTIFVLHSSNFSRETLKDERETLIRPLSEAD